MAMTAYGSLAEESLADLMVILPGIVLSALIALAILILVPVLVARTKSPRRSIHSAPPPDGSWAWRARPGQIWWADVPYRGGEGSKERPCLVVRTHQDGIEVLQITSKAKPHLPFRMQIPTKSWDPKARTDSTLDFSGTPRFVDNHRVRRLLGSCDARVWNVVTQYHQPGWVYDAQEPRR
ncbi:type II toxin-antitoxin system PemK/MazF family toxin [Nonomuraea turkmeniaca]|nr:type II toxin-antitoxin system PemK/MazF family toxin [Nonomuraea turkmeniaca]